MAKRTSRRPNWAEQIPNLGVHVIGGSHSYSSREVGRVTPDVAYQLGQQADHPQAAAPSTSGTTLF